MKCRFAITAFLIVVILMLSCKKEYSYEGGNTPIPTNPSQGDTNVTINTDSTYVDPAIADLNTWHFTDSISGQYFSGIFKTNPLQSSFTNSALYVLGWDANIVTDTAFIVTMFFDNGIILPGIYPCDELHNNEVTLEASNDAIYSVSGSVGFVGKTPSYITITNYDETIKKLTGSFHVWGHAYHADYFPSLITGSFNCTLP